MKRGVLANAGGRSLDEVQKDAEALDQKRAAALKKALEPVPAPKPTPVKRVNVYRFTPKQPYVYRDDELMTDEELLALETASQVIQ